MPGLTGGALGSRLRGLARGRFNALGISGGLGFKGLGFHVLGL